jgi:hypothetical protein
MLLCSQIAERQKATRQLKKLRKLLLETESEEEVAIVKTKMHVAEVDLNYTQYFPLNQRYISLYPQKNVGESEIGSQDETADDVTAKPSMWAEVERRMAEGTLNQLRDGPSATVVGRNKISSSQSTRVKSKAGSIQQKAKGQLNGAAAKPQTGLTRPKKDSDLAERRAPISAPDDRDDENESDGGFFEE